MYPVLQHTPHTQLLAAAGADVDAADRGGNCALHAAATKGNATVLAAVLAAGATVDKKQVDGKQAPRRPRRPTTHAHVLQPPHQKHTHLFFARTPASTLTFKTPPAGTTA